MKARMLVHVLLFRQNQNDHLEIVLEWRNEQGGLFYNIDQWTTAQKNLSKTLRYRKGDEFVDLPFEDFLKEASDIESFELDLDLEEVVSSWCAHQKNTTKRFIQAVNHNCADAVIWFLNRFGGMPKPSAFSRPIRTHHAFYCLSLPSIFNCVSLPERVMGDIVAWRASLKTNNQSDSETPSAKLT